MLTTTSNREIWTKTTLGEVVTFQRGFDLPESERMPGLYPVIAATGKVGTHFMAPVAGPGVVIGRSGSIGGGQYITTDFWPLNTTLWVKDFKGNDPRFCYYLLKTLDFSTFNAGSGVPTLNRNHIHPITVEIPTSLDHQKRIAQILGTFDDKIELNRQMAATLEEMARAIFKSWFIDFDPVRAKAEGCPTNLPREIEDLLPSTFEEDGVPTGWRIRALDSFGKFLNGLALQKYPPTTEETLPVIKIAQLRTMNTSDADRCGDNIPAEYVVKNGDILFSWSGSLECVVWTGGAGGLNQHLFKVTSDEVPDWFMYFAIQEYLPWFRSVAASKATTMGHIQRKHLTEATVAFSETAIAVTNSVLDQLYKRMWRLKRESATLAEIRDSLLPHLMTPHSTSSKNLKPRNIQND